MSYSYGKKPSYAPLAAIAIGILIIMVFINPSPTNQTTTTTEGIACAQDVKQCPDNSYVSRNPANNCQFFDCPVTTTTVTTTTTIATTTTVETTTTIAGNQPPIIISATASPNPIRTGKQATFSVVVSDAESEFVTVSVCKNALCTGRYCTQQGDSTATGANITCTYVIPVTTTGELNFWAQAQEAGHSSAIAGPFTLTVTPI